MKISDYHDHLRGLQGVKYKNDLFDELKDILTIENIRFGYNQPKEIKQIVSDKFNEKGWADKVRVGNSKLTISFVKSKIGVCFQIGNVARTYADILKLSQLYKTQIIDVGVMIVPNNPESKKMGANYANFKRLVNELNHFKDIVPIPILVIALSN